MLHEHGNLQAKLDVSDPADPAEREAERVADEVMRTERPNEATDPVNVSAIQRSPSGGVGGETLTTDAEATVRSSLGGGKPLDSSTRASFESRFGRDFSAVRVHTGANTDKTARSITAKAFTLGSDIGFAKGMYEPETSTGEALLAHELTHVVQQAGAPTDRADPGGLAAGTVVGRGLVQRSSDESEAEQADVLPNAGQFFFWPWWRWAGNELDGAESDAEDEDETEDFADRIETVIANETEAYQNLEITIGDEENETTIQVEATYFINTNTRGDTHEHRNRSGFTDDTEDVKDALTDRTDTQFKGTTGGNYRVGRAVELGKASPVVLETFIQQAWNDGVIQAYSDRDDLGPENTEATQEAVQEYVDEVGIGVDCSGLVTHMLTEIRRELAEDVDLPQGVEVRDSDGELLGHRVDEGEVRVWNRAANQFARDGDEIEHPRDIQAGHVGHKSGHIVIVSEGATQNDDGEYEFTIVESAPVGSITLENTPDEGVTESTITVEVEDEDDPWSDHDEYDFYQLPSMDFD